MYLELRPVVPDMPSVVPDIYLELQIELLLQRHSLVRSSMACNKAYKIVPFTPGFAYKIADQNGFCFLTAGIRGLIELENLK